MSEETERIFDEEEWRKAWDLFIAGKNQIIAMLPDTFEKQMTEWQFTQAGLSANLCYRMIPQLGIKIKKINVKGTGENEGKPT